MVQSIGSARYVTRGRYGAQEIRLWSFCNLLLQAVTDVAPNTTFAYVTEEKIEHERPSHPRE